MNCTKCGAPLEEGARFCNSCGAPAGRSQPTREEIRARVQGRGRHAAPSHAAPRTAPAVEIPTDLPTLLCLGAGILGLLQLIYLLVKTLFWNLEDLSYSVSVFAAMKESSPFLAILLLLVCLGVLASVAVPFLLRRRPMPMVTAAASGVLLLMFVIIVLALKSVSKSEIGIKPSLGFFGWMFMLNCLLIPGLVYLADRWDESAPAREAAPVREAEPARAAAPRRPVGSPNPARPAPLRRGVNGPSRPTAPTQYVTPPDAETIAALRRMAQMHKEGLVSDEEFARIKAECVARGWIRE